MFMICSQRSEAWPTAAAPPKRLAPGPGLRSCGRAETGTTPMRHLAPAAALAALLLLAACQTVDPGGAAAPPAGTTGGAQAASAMAAAVIEVTPLAPAVPAAAPAAEPEATPRPAVPTAPEPAANKAAASPAKPDATPPPPPADPDPAAGEATAPPAAADAAAAPPAPPPSPQQQACERGGGRYVAAGASGARACVLPTRDAGKRCRRETDCDGLCLARSQTCAPIKPLFGCNDILQADGRRVTLCVD